MLPPKHVPTSTFGSPQTMSSCEARVADSQTVRGHNFLICYKRDNRRALQLQSIAKYLHRIPHYAFYLLMPENSTR